MLEHLPPGNPAARELNESPWGDPEVLLHDISSSLRVLAVQHANRYRRKGSPEHTLQLLPTPGDDPTEQDTRAPEQVLTEQTHLIEVLNRAHPH